MSDKIDPMIQREFDRLGYNVIENEKLAELIIEKVNRRRNLMIGVVGVTIAIVTIIAALIFSGLNQNSGLSRAGGSASSLTRLGDGNGAAPLPLTGYLDIKGSNPKTAQGVFLFNLNMGEMMQLITDDPDPSQGIVGQIEVYLIQNGSPDRLVQTYDMGSHTHINEFSAPTDGSYRWVLKFNNPNFQGRVRFAFVRTH